MKKLNYAKYLITKEWLPLFIVFTLIGLVSYFSYLMSFSFYNNSSYEVSLSALTAPMLVFAAVLPLFVYNYKYSLKRGDTYYQLPLKQRELKNTRILAGLFILVASFIIASLLPYLAFMIRYVSSPDYVRIGGTTFFKFFEAAPYLGAIAVALVAVVIEYFISCFFCSLVSKPVSAILISISFHLVLVLTLYVLFQNIYNLHQATYIYHEDYWYNFGDGANAAVNYSPGIVITINLPDYIARVYAFGFSGREYAVSNVEQGVIVASIVVELLFGASACFLTLFMKDDSGESCNNYGFANKKLNSLFFLSTIPVALFALGQGYTFGFDDILITVIAAAAYYFLFALFIGSFKMPVYSYAIIGAMSGIILIGDLFLAIFTGNMA